MPAKNTMILVFQPAPLSRLKTILDDDQGECDFSCEQ